MERSQNLQAMWQWIECSWTPKSKVLDMFPSGWENTVTLMVRTHHLGDNTSVTQLLNIGLVLSPLWSFSFLCLLASYPFFLLFHNVGLHRAHHALSLLLFMIFQPQVQLETASVALFFLLGLPERKSDRPRQYFYSRPHWSGCWSVCALLSDASGAHHLFTLHKEHHSSFSK